MRFARQLRLLAAFWAVSRPALAGDAVPEPPRLGACGIAPGFVLPGTDACLRVSGFVGVEAGGRQAPQAAFAPLSQASAPHVAGDDVGRSAIGTDARLSVDVRMPTDLGEARLLVSVRGRHGALSSAR